MLQALLSLGSGRFLLGGRSGRAAARGPDGAPGHPRALEGARKLIPTPDLRRLIGTLRGDSFPMYVFLEG